MITVHLSHFKKGHLSHREPICRGRLRAPAVAEAHARGALRRHEHVLRHVDQHPIAFSPSFVLLINATDSILPSQQPTQRFLFCCTGL